MKVGQRLYACQHDHWMLQSAVYEIFVSRDRQSMMIWAGEAQVGLTGAVLSEPLPRLLSCVLVMGLDSHISQKSIK